MKKRRPCTFNTTTVPCSPILSISLLLLSLILDASGQQQNNNGGSSGTTGFYFQEGGPGPESTTANIACGGSALQLYNNILSLGSHISANAYLRSPNIDVAGRCYFNESLVNLLDSFNTQFTFTLAPHSNVSEEAIDGIAFVIFQDSTSFAANNVGMPGGYLGVLDDASHTNSSVNANRTFAIEFDAFTNPEFNDPLYHHVGIDHGSMNSTVTAQAGYHQTAPCSDQDTFIAMNLTGEGRIQAWIEYNGSTQQLSVSTSPLMGVKPPKPLLTTKVNLSEMFPEKTGVYVGFSSSTGRNFSGWAYVLGWSFNISGAATPLYPERVVVTKCPTTYDPWARVYAIISKVISFYSILGSFGGQFIAQLLLYYWRRYQRRQFLHKQFELLELENMDYRPKQYSYKELSKATKNFSTEQVLGRGGFGVVYKGTLSASGGSTAVAVKKIIRRRNSNSVHDHDQQEFVSEMNVIGRLRHRNLVQLLGWCHEKKGELMQVYEYMPNGSLDRLLFSRTPDDGLIALSWDQRFHIITGLAAALVYLHEEWKQLIVHRDVKVSNVMLDASFNARLGDFGLARLCEHSQTPDFTNVAGTLGYMAPEIMYGEFTEKSDAFSFGIVALEVAAGRRSIDSKRPPGEARLAAWVLTLNEEERMLDAADVRLDGSFKEVELLRVLHVGLLCSQPEPDVRPTMRQALQMLNGESPLTPLPTPPSEAKIPLNFDSGEDETDSRAAGSNVSSPWPTNEIAESPGAPLLVGDLEDRLFENSTTYSRVSDTSLKR